MLFEMRPVDLSAFVENFLQKIVDLRSNWINTMENLVRKSEQFRVTAETRTKNKMCS